MTYQGKIVNAKLKARYQGAHKLGLYECLASSP